MTLSPGGAAEELVPVHVPRSLLNEVYRFVAERMAEVAGPPESDDSTHNQPQESPVSWSWSIEAFRRLIADRRNSAHRSGLLFDVLAERPDIPVALSELATGTGLTVGQVRGALTGLTLICNEYWPDHGADGIWPMRKVWRPIQNGAQQGELHYVMKAENARRWLRARAGD